MIFIINVHNNLRKCIGEIIHILFIQCVMIGGTIALIITVFKEPGGELRLGVVPDNWGV